MVMVLSDCRPGHNGKNTNNNNNLSRWFDSGFREKFSRHIENTRKNSPQPSGLLAFLLVSGEPNVRGEFCRFRTRELSRWPRDGWCVRQSQASQDRRRMPRRRIEIRQGRVEPAKISDVTGGGLYLFVTPDASRPGSAASKLWRMATASKAARKLTPSDHGNGRDGTFSPPTRGASATKLKTCSITAARRSTKTTLCSSSGSRPGSYSKFLTAMIEIFSLI